MSCSAGKSDDPLNELTITPLPGYSISSDGVTMCATACTPEGRIFLGGGDGHLYEVVYNLAGGWRQQRCAKAKPFTDTLFSILALCPSPTFRLPPHSL